jgi:hypothetical protein
VDSCASTRERHNSADSTAKAIATFGMEASVTAKAKPFHSWATASFVIEVRAKIIKASILLFLFRQGFEQG